MDTKVCFLCKTEKDIEEFSFKNKAEGIRTSYCKSCQKIKARAAHVKAWPEKKVKRKEIKKGIKEWILKYKKDHGCACGEKHPACLDFHHINPEEKEFQISNFQRNKSLKRIKEEITKCIIICSNCHRKLHWNERQFISVTAIASGFDPGERGSIPLWTTQRKVRPSLLQL